MMNIETFVVNPFMVNCYLLFDETKEAVIIDPGCYALEEREAVVRFVEREGLRVCHVLCTHLHPDHIFSLRYFSEHYGVLPGYHVDDKDHLLNAARRSRLLGLVWPEEAEAANANDEFCDLRDGEVIRFGLSELTVLHTPGHTLGGVCFYAARDGVVFTGDTLFQHSVGRTDLSGGSFPQLQHSIREKLFVLPPATKVYPGHGNTTGIATEVENNPYM